MESFDFIREIHWHSKTEEPIFKGGHPWFIVDDMVLKGENKFAFPLGISISTFGFYLYYNY